MLSVREESTFGALEGVTLPATFRGPVSTINFCFPQASPTPLAATLY